MSDGYAVKVKPEKVEAVEKIRVALDAAEAAVITEYRGLSVTDLAELRGRLSEAETTYRVVKNTFARRAATDLGLSELEEFFVGPVAIAYVKGDIVAASKAIADFAKDHPELEVKGGVLEGKVIGGDAARGLAKIDPLPVSRAKIAGLLTSPLRKVMMLAEAPARKILFVLEQLGQREGSETATEGAGGLGGAGGFGGLPREEASEQDQSEPTAENDASEQSAPNTTSEAAEAATETDNENTNKEGDES